VLRNVAPQTDRIGSNLVARRRATHKSL
jgi:hypothetical protein